MFGDDELFYLKAYFESGKTKLEKEHKLMLLEEINKRWGLFFAADWLKMLQYRKQILNLWDGNWC